MQVPDELFDVVIIGSGMGGLACGNILAREGKKVIVLEKNRQIGGNLQVFSRDKCVFDTGVHYLGGLDDGQNLNKLFRYFGIYDELKLKRLDSQGFDHIYLKDDKTPYKYGMGYDNFKERLCTYFPHEKDAIDAYCKAVLDVINNLPLARLESASNDSIMSIDLSTNAQEFINGLTSDKKLQMVLGATNMLYAGNRRTPFFVHALVMHSYIESSWRCVDGAAQIAKLMTKRIRERGGSVMNRCEVSGGEFNESGRLDAVILANGKKVRGKDFISNMHPKTTIKVFGRDKFSKAYAERIENLKDSASIFTLHLVFHENSFEYLNHNIFQVNNKNVWDLEFCTEEDWPNFYMFSVPPNSENERYAKGASVMCGMMYEEVRAWGHTYNNVKQQASRGPGYEGFKKRKAEKVITALEQHFPDIRKKIRSYTCSTALTIRDYLGSPEGTAYGVEKDSNAVFKTLVSPRTPVPNLYLTGQNLTLHGILGVSLSALLTCFNLVDKEKIMNDIKHN